MIEPDGAVLMGDRERRSEAGQCRPGLAVPDLDAFRRRMLESGVPCLQEPKSLFGARVAQYADPDGLPLSVSQDRQPR